MNLGHERESTNFTDDTNPTGLQYVKNVIGSYLYKHQWVKGANGQMYNPEQDAAWQTDHLRPIPKLDAQGRRADIDWGSNAALPPGLMSSATNQSPTATASPAVQPGASSGGLLDRLFSAVKGR